MSQLQTRLDKYSRREFRPMRLAYTPGVFQRLRYSLLDNNPIFPLHVNDKPFGWISPYSKYEIGELLPQELTYKTSLYIHNQSTYSQEKLRDHISQMGFETPFVIKPDYGERGKGVEIIRTKEDFFSKITQEYLRYRNRVLVQEYAKEQIEVGIGYAFNPVSHTGKTTGMVAKEFMTVVGDGNSTIGGLVKSHTRGHFYIEQLEKTLSKIWDDVLDEGIVYELLSIGNHARGSTFFDKSDEISKQLEEKIVAISSNIRGFYFGRYDIRAVSREALMRGQFKIIELNGADSEPTRIYDPNFHFWQGRSTLRKRQSMIYALSLHRNIKSGSVGNFLDDMYAHSKYLPKSIVMLLHTRNFLTLRNIAKIVIAIILLQTLYFKFGGHPESVQLFTKIGMEPRGRIGTGVIELLVSIGIFIPKTEKISIFGVIVLMIGAIFFHVTILGTGDLLFALAVLSLTLATGVLFSSRLGK